MNETPPGTLSDPAAAEEPSFAGLGLEPAPAPGAATPYRVLARKYRPQTFDDLIGQEAMVRTVSNAFETNRIPQAWMLTGVRGVGKTTTARILARALNYELDGPEGRKAGPSIAMPELGLHCQAIMESRHVDVLEMDAASHTGVDNMRQITDSVRYAPVSARYKVYIIDEVHMLSTQAFNAFLKTLEEPPPHAKFVFATTEIRKVPVTILSRCQRFDLRRIEADVLGAHLSRICDLEKVSAEPEAIAAIVRAAEGSVRDALSLLDQAVAHGAGLISAATVREMLGLADRAQVIDLFEAVMRGDVKASFAFLRHQYDAGADPATILSDLAAFTHLVTRFKLVPEAANDPSLSEAERVRGQDFAAKLSVRTLSRAWQILLKGSAEVKDLPLAIAGAEMVLVRLAYAADLPTPDEALRALKEGGAGFGRGQAAISSRGAEGGASGMAIPNGGPNGGSSGPTMRAVQNGAQASAASSPMMRMAPAPEPAEAPQPRLMRFEDVVAMAGERRHIALKAALERDVRLVRFEEGRLEFAAPTGAPTLANDLKRALTEWTGRPWVVALSREPGEATLAERRQAADQERKTGAAAHPLVQAVMKAFPGAAIVNVHERAAAADEATAPSGSEADPGAVLEPVPEDDD